MSEGKSNHLVLKIILGVAGGIIVAFVAIMIVVGLAANKAAEEVADEIEAALNTTRKTDATKLAGQILSYQTNNNGRLPSKPADIEGYLPKIFMDPDGTEYEIIVDTLSAGDTQEVTRFNHTMYVVLSGKCSGEKAVYSSNKRDFAVLYRLTDETTYCYSS